MKRRILSLVLAIAMCFTVLSTAVIADDAELMGSALGDTLRLYTDRVWDWQEGQFDAMTDEQRAVVEAAYANYSTKADDVKAVATSVATTIVGDNTTFLEQETMEDLYKWKMMRDIMEGNADVTVETVEPDGYADWLERFTAFEQANDEAISASKPNAALNGLGEYSAALTAFYGEVAAMYLVDNSEVTGADADKFKAYADAFAAGDDLTTVTEYLKADVIELMAEGVYNYFDLVIQVACGEKVRGDVVFDEIPDKDLKAGFLMLGEELARDYIDAVPALREDMVAMNKKALISEVAKGDVLNIMSASNETAANSMYTTMIAVAEYIEGQDFMAEPVEKLEDLGFNVADYHNAIVDGIKEVMALLDDEHGLELVHFNTYVGRSFLNPEPGYVLEVEAGTEASIEQFYAHDRYTFVKEAFETLDLTQFDVVVTGDTDAIVVELDDAIGIINVDATNAEPGDEVVVELYRGYEDEDVDGVVDDTASAADAYRYVGTYVVKATGDVEPPVAPYVVLEDVLDVELGEKITVKADTNLPYVTVAIIKNGETVYAVVYDNTEITNGITLEVPADAVAGEVYTVVVGTDAASDSDEFTVLGSVEEYFVELDDIANTTVDGTIVVSGTTNLPYVTVAVIKNGETIYAVVYEKAEFALGITLEAPADAEVGDVYTVVVGTSVAADSTDFAIIDETVEYFVELEDIADFKLSEKTEITVQGTTNLPYVVVTITKDGETVYAVVYEKAEFELGIALNVPDGAEEGDVYTVVVGTELAEAVDTFEILSEESTDEPTDEPTSEPTDEPTEPVVVNSGSLAIAGSTTRYVKVGKTIDITATPQNVKPEDATVEIVWALEDGTILEIKNVAVNEENNASIATIERLVKGNTTVTATLYVNGEAVDVKTITVKLNKPTPIPSDDDTAEKVAVKVDEETSIKTVTDGGVTVEYEGTGAGKITVEIVDGKIVVTGTEAGTTEGVIKVYDNNGKLISTGEYVFVVTDKDVVVPEHKCEWPDIVGHWAHLTIDEMTINGYINGYEDGTFKPDQNITRAEFSAIVYRILGLEEAEDGVLYDDTVGHWAEDIIATMSLPEGYGMTRGYGDGNFGPDEYITREQAVAIIARAKSAVWVAAEENAKDVFTDAEDISWWFDGEMDAAVTNGLITGYEDGSYKPLDFTTRAEACTLLARAWPEVVE